MARFVFRQQSKLHDFMCQTHAIHESDVQSQPDLEAFHGANSGGNCDSSSPGASSGATSTDRKRVNRGHGDAFINWRTSGSGARYFAADRSAAHRAGRHSADTSASDTAGSDFERRQIQL
jgi:hypothetical protein